MGDFPRNVTLPVRQEPLWYAEGLRFNCTQCGNCCSGGPGYVWVTPEDMARIAAFLKVELEAFTKKYMRLIGQAFSLTEKADYDCIFLKREGGKGGKAICGIYPVRPMQCRTWPFWNTNLKSPDAWTRASERCPGMCDADAPTYDLAHIEKNRTNPESP